MCVRASYVHEGRIIPPRLRGCPPPAPQTAAVGSGAECADEQTFTLSTLVIPICDEKMTLASFLIHIRIQAVSEGRNRLSGYSARGPAGPCAAGHLHVWRRSGSTRPGSCGVRFIPNEPW